MTIEYLSEKLDDAERKRIADIFAAFERIFPDVCYVNRGKIVGVGCPGLYLFCYYKIEQDGVFVKFKCSQSAVRLCDETVDFDSLIAQTIYLIKEIGLIPKEKNIEEFLKSIYDWINTLKDNNFKDYKSVAYSMNLIYKHSK